MGLPLVLVCGHVAWRGAAVPAAHHCPCPSLGGVVQICEGARACWWTGRVKVHENMGKCNVS